MRKGNGQDGGYSCRSISLDLTLKTVFDWGEGNKTVREFYDIEFREPPSTEFSLPSGLSVDHTHCRGCDNNPTQ